ncbi:MAG: NUDIX hydrolase [Pseudomonadota bacterium]
MTPTFEKRVPKGDDRVRDVCAACGFVAYDNPKIVVGAVVHYGASVLLCRRAIEPSRGLWTIPAGYMEHGETPDDGARREAHEEAAARIVIDGLLAVYAITRIGQVQLIYRAHLASPAFAPGPETLELGLFAPDEIPWDDLAFPTVRWALTQAPEPGGPFGNMAPA